MSGMSVPDMLALADAINARKSSDDKFAELLGELSTALAEILAAMESKAEAKPAIDSDALGKAIAAALVVGLKNMPAPTVKVDMPAMPAQAGWSTLSVTPKLGANGRPESYVITRK